MKKLLLVILALTVFVLSCGNKSTTSGSAGASNNDVIKIGVIAPLTGDVAQYGVAVKEGVEMKVAEINAAGGINGKKIELVISDSKGDSQEAVNIFKKMISQDKVNLIIGEVISSASLAIADLAQRAQIPMISASATNLDVTKGKDFVFRTTFTDPFQGIATAKYAKEKEFKSVAILTNTSSDYAVGLAEAFKTQASKDGLTIIEEKYTKDDKDFKSILTKIKGQNPEAIFVPDYYNTIGLILTQANELGIKVVIAVTDKNGNLILLNRMEDSLIASIELAGKKAYTSVVLNMCTSEVLNCGLDEIVSSMEGKIVAFGGGLPVRTNGKLIGGIGISGGTVEQDVEIAQYAVNAVLN